MKSWGSKYDHIDRPEFGKKIFQEDFSSTATKLLDKQWIYEGAKGTWEIKEEALYLSGAGGYKFLLLPGSYTDFSLKVDMKYLSTASPLGLCYEYSDSKNYRAAHFQPRDIYEYFYVDQMSDGKWMIPSD